MPDIAPVWPALASAVAAGAAAAAAWFSYSVHRRNLASKVMDRLYELDKLMLANPASYSRFLQAKTLRDAYTATSLHSAEELGIQVRALAYIYINLLDEAFGAFGTDQVVVKAGSDWHAWATFIWSRVRHPLLTEIVLSDCNVLPDGSLAAKQSTMMSPRFIAFLCNSAKEWRGKPVDTMVF